MQGAIPLHFETHDVISLPLKPYSPIQAIKPNAQHW